MSIKEDLAAESAKKKNMYLTSLRIPHDLAEKIHAYIGRNQGITEAAVLRKCVEIGWLQVEADEQRV